MHRSINNSDIDWRKDFDDEMTLTEDEQKQKDAEDLESQRIFEDLMATIDEIERQDYAEYVRDQEEDEMWAAEQEKAAWDSYDADAEHDYYEDYYESELSLVSNGK